METRKIMTVVRTNKEWLAGRIHGFMTILCDDVVDGNKSLAYQVNDEENIYLFKTVTTEEAYERFKKRVSRESDYIYRKCTFDYQGSVSDLFKTE